ncbi:MAG TPA: competence/damage-inducible protein A [Phycisphaerae bacterium]|nr:competence/damage-inducible protein A [Phycisphaerae bacterium]
MRAVIIAVGDELITGATLDTNSAELASHLTALGIAVTRHLTVGDDAEPIADAIGAAAAEADLVLVTGGLGPTLDDLSRQGLAQAMGVELVEDPRQIARIAAFFTALGREMKPSNRTQALIPAGADAIDNDWGTAPGIAARIGAARIFVLPGPPQEMRAVFGERVEPLLVTDGAIVRRLLQTYGAGESDVGERIADLMDRRANPTVGTTVREGVITVRITARDPDPDAARRAADRTAREVRRRLGEMVFGEDDQTLPGVIGDALRGAGATVAVAESCTGGLVGKLLTDPPGASQWFVGGTVAYSNEVKTDHLGVPAEALATGGAVSEPVARALAEGARQRFGADWGIGVTGIAGPTGGTADKPVGLVYIAIASNQGADVRRHTFIGPRDRIRSRASMTALNLLRLALRAAGKTTAGRHQA